MRVTELYTSNSVGLEGSSCSGEFEEAGKWGPGSFKSEGEFDTNFVIVEALRLR